jgi:hypothetical protein
MIPCPFSLRCRPVSPIWRLFQALRLLTTGRMKADLLPLNVFARPIQVNVTMPNSAPTRRFTKLADASNRTFGEMFILSAAF